MRVTKARLGLLCFLGQATAVTYWFGAYYAPIAFPNIHEAFSLGNWLLGGFLGWLSSAVVFLFAVAWDAFGD